MRFEHLIAINDPALPDLPVLAPCQLWRGLLLRIREPRRFLPGLEGAEVIELAPGLFQRRLDFGAFAVEDRVEVDAALRIEVRIVEPAQYRGTRLSIRIESPAAGCLNVRFVYVSPEAGYTAELDAAERRVLENAWLAADRDCIALIRRYAAAGLLDD